MPEEPQPSPQDKKQPKNIVVCCDGTGNEFGDSNSNVVKLYTACLIGKDTGQVKNDGLEQVGYYHPGVGTMGSPTARGKLSSRWSVLKGLAFAAGFKDNVLDAYSYLMKVYDDGDRVYLFGFSRGSYTARALAGLLHGYGLLCRGNEGHIPYAWRMFTDQVAKKKDQETKGTAEAHHKGHGVVPDDAFKETFSNPNFNFHFVGLWDTVSSVGWISTPLRLLYVAQNPTIRTGRHAVSIDERRCFYRDNLWGDPLPGQDIVQVWFPGVHSDVGGSYPLAESALAITTLRWMFEQADAAGLRLIPEKCKLVLGELDEVTAAKYAAASLYMPAPDYYPIHHSLNKNWWPLEVLPHRFYDKDDAKEKWRIPLGVRRHIPPGALVHPTVVERMKNHPEYAPPNLPASDLTRLSANPPWLPKLPNSPEPDEIGTIADLSGYYMFKLAERKPANQNAQGAVASNISQTDQFGPASPQLKSANAESRRSKLAKAAITTTAAFLAAGFLAKSLLRK
jgi:uncharacterized protein (DUF2235 family)